MCLQSTPQGRAPAARSGCRLVETFVKASDLGCCSVQALHHDANSIGHASSMGCMVGAAPWVGGVEAVEHAAHAMTAVHPCVNSAVFAWFRVLCLGLHAPAYAVAQSFSTAAWGSRYEQHSGLHQSPAIWLNHHMLHTAHCCRGMAGAGVQKANDGAGVQHTKPGAAVMPTQPHRSPITLAGLASPRAAMLRRCSSQCGGCRVLVPVTFRVCMQPICPALCTACWSLGYVRRQGMPGTFFKGSCSAVGARGRRRHMPVPSSIPQLPPAASNVRRCAGQGMHMPACAARIAQLAAAQGRHQH
jgi:hypothetical protein